VHVDAVLASEDLFICCTPFVIGDRDEYVSEETPATSCVSAPVDADKCWRTSAHLP